MSKPAIVPLASAKGFNGEILLFPDRIRIVRKGWLTPSGRGEKEILLSSITSIQMRPASLLINGFIQFAFSGGKESKGGVIDATRDENAVMFRKGSQAEFDTLKAKIDEAKSALSHGSGSPAGAPASPIEQLAQLAKLKDQGVVTEEEFQTKKKQLLGL